MPAEWHPHEKCWMHWPYRADNWRLDAKPARGAFVNVIKAISKYEPVFVAASAACLQSAKESIEGLENVHIVEIDSDDSWMRDTGPTFVIRGDADADVGADAVRGVDWSFNSWGGLMEVKHDNLVAGRICAAEQVQRYCTHEPLFILEGGSVHVDGEGTCLTTEECLLNPNRNAHLNKEQIEEKLKAYLGVQTVIWLSKGLTGDEDTNGHVDNMACFCAPGRVLLSWTDDETDEFHPVCRTALAELLAARDAKGRALEVVKLPVPPVMRYSSEEVASLAAPEAGASALRTAGERLAASYVNFYVANGAVVLPSFGHAEADAEAARIVGKCFPGRAVEQVADAREILLGGGNIHCITQQQPRKR
jgi:agmatine deiminase